MTNPTTATAEELDRWLATEVMGWTQMQTACAAGWSTAELFPSFAKDMDWSPTTDRNHLAEVLAKVPVSKQFDVVGGVLLSQREHRDQLAFTIGWTMLTADPLEVSRAIVAAMQEKRQ